MPVYGPSDIYHLQRGTCQHSFAKDADRYSMPISSDETRSLPVLECDKGCMEWALEPRNGWKARPEQVAFTQTEIDNEITLKGDAGNAFSMIGEAVAAAMRQQQGIISDGVDIRKAPTRARRTR
jgi:hypothetical protein